MAKSYRIEGMNCGHCVATVQKALDARGIRAQVTLDPPRVTLSRDTTSAADVAAAVAAAGDYKLTGEVVPAPAGGLFSGIRKALKF